MIKLKDMIPNIAYVVATNGITLKIGDHILKEADGCIMCKEAHGFLTPDDWRYLRNKVVVDREYYREKLVEMKEQM